MKNTCSNCRFWAAWSQDARAHPRTDFGECRRYSPRVFEMPHNGPGEPRFRSKWPATRPTEFCGQWAPVLNDSQTVGEPVSARSPIGLVVPAELPTAEEQR